MMSRRIDSRPLRTKRIVGSSGSLMLVLIAFACPPVHGEGPVLLREDQAEGDSTQVRIDLKAEGLFRPALPPGEMTDEAKMPKPLALDVKTRLIFSERILKTVSAEGVAKGERSVDGA